MPCSDGRGRLPRGAHEARKRILAGFAQGEAALARKSMADAGDGDLEGLFRRTFTARRNLHFVSSECRFMGDPVDMVVFEEDI